MNIRLFSAALVIVFALASCTTLANRRDLFGPNKPEGEYTNRYNEAIGKPSKSGKPVFRYRTTYGVPN